MPGSVAQKTAIIRTLIMGPPGSGKGTISSRITAQYNCKHLSSGDLLREHIRQKSAIGVEARSYISQGQLVPDSTITKLMMAELKKLERKNWLLDGFPRTVKQAIKLDDKFDIDIVINLDVPFTTITDRISKRWIHPASGRTYNLDFSPPKVEGIDDVTGEPLVQREDDKPDSVRKRLQLYSEMTEPLLDYYGKQKKLATFKGTETNVIWPAVKQFLDDNYTH